MEDPPVVRESCHNQWSSDQGALHQQVFDTDSKWRGLEEAFAFYLPYAGESDVEQALSQAMVKNLGIPESAPIHGAYLLLGANELRDILRQSSAILRRAGFACVAVS